MSRWRRRWRGQSSPEKPWVPLPAMVVMRPVVVDLADAMVAGVGDVEVFCWIEGEGRGEVELGGGGGGVVAGEAGGGSRDGGDDAGGEVEFADAVVVGVGDVEVVCGVEGEALGGVECGGGGGAAVAGEALCAGAGDGGDVADGVDLADDVVGGLGEVEIAGGVEDDGGGKDERDGQCGDLSGQSERRSQGEQEEERNPKRTAAGARRVCDALRTHEELARCFL